MSASLWEGRLRELLVMIPFTEEGYVLPAQGEADMKTDWSWLYGTLPPGTYRITKTFTDSNRKDPNVNMPAYPLKAQFIIAG